MFEIARSGIWYTENIDISNTIIEAPKTFRRAKGIKLENVTVYDYFISGEYLGWNSKNLTFVNCTIESLQSPVQLEK